MADVVLSASVRQNLLSLQSTADLLSTTQNRLASGKKVNTALDNPTNFFTAAGLDSRASDINNLLDGIGNGVQILQAANTGITSLNKLVDTAKSIANQALQTTVGYSTKSNVSATITGATPDDLRGTTSYTSANAVSKVITDGTAGGAHPVTGATTLGATSASLVGVAATTGAGGTTALAVGLTLIGGPSATTIAGPAAPVDGDTVTVNGKTITFRSGSAASAVLPSGSGIAGNIITDGNGNSTVYLGTTAAPAATVQNLADAIDLASGVKKATISNGVASITHSSGTDAAISAGGVLTLTTGTGSDLSISGKADLLNGLGLTTGTGSGPATVTKGRTIDSSALGTLVQDGSTLNVNGKTITFKNATAPATPPAGSGVLNGVVTDGSGNSTVYLQGGTVADVLTAIDIATGAQGTTISAAGALTLKAGTGVP